MECNKEEANRAKGIAETKMHNKDFVGARKTALRAQQIFPDLENILQMLAVCNVHCAAEEKMVGNESDWYGILQVEQTADDVLIKKQYRKFALLLHPDKNKFPGAEAAFKMIGEAQRVLLDPEKRNFHDMKRRASLRPAAPNYPPKQAGMNSYVGKQPGVQVNIRSNTTPQYTAVHPQHTQPQQQSQPWFSNKSFLTSCPFCHMKYQCEIGTLKKYMTCPTCRQPFIANDINPGVPLGTNGSRPIFPQQKAVPNQKVFTSAPRNVFENSTSSVKFQGNVSENPKKGPSQKTECAFEVGKGSKTNENFGNADKRVEKDGGPVKFNPSGNADKRVEKDLGGSGKSKSSEKGSGKKRKKQVEESSESCDTGGSDTEEDIPIKQAFGFYGEHLRRSSRSKQEVSYNQQTGDNDDAVRPSKKAKGSEDTVKKGESSEMNKQADVKVEKKVKQEEGAFDGISPKGNKQTKKVNGKQTESSDSLDLSMSSSSREVTPDPEFYECPDPDFSDFDKDRAVDCFKVGQMWAVYDTIDAMPRFYAIIKRVFSTGFKLKIAWLEADPDDKEEIKWVNADLPVSCGKFKQGHSEDTQDRLMFSHLVFWERDGSRSPFKIYPRKGETWALFKNWDMKWYSDQVYRKYELEFVEVLEEYNDDIGIRVAYLGKVKGYSSLFCRIVEEGKGSFLIPKSELYRFSHKVPSCKIGEEKGVPKGSFELDPASVPTDLEATIFPEDLKVKDGDAEPNGSCSKSPEEKVKPTDFDPWDNGSKNVKKDPNSSPSCLEAHELPQPEFYDFEGDKSKEKFQVDQIWALYSDEDALPKYYGQIKKVVSDPEFKLHVTWLISTSGPEDKIQWVDKDMPVCCGRYKVNKGKPKVFPVDTFSHQLKAENIGRKNEYAILPRKGEVWAVYKNWNDRIKCSDLENCEYDVVEVLEENEVRIEVQVLERLDGFNSVFKVKGGSDVRMEILRVELLRFSHQIPAFRLTEERGGSLRGFWELDPAAVPVLMFCSS